MHFNAFVFDLDGTLLNTLADIAQAANTLLERHGWPPHPLEAYRQFIGNGFARLVRRALPAGVLEQLHDDEVARLVQEGKEHYSARLWTLTKPYEGVPEALHALAARGCRLAVLSNKPDSQTVTLVEHFFPGLFQAVHGSRDGIPLKPDPTSLLSVVDELGVSADKVGYVGDSNVDMLTAANAGLFSMGVCWGFRGEAELVSAGAGALIRQASELLDYAPDTKSQHC